MTQLILYTSEEWDSGVKKSLITAVLGDLSEIQTGSKESAQRR